MTRRTLLAVTPLAIAATTLKAADSYSGPRPPKKDVAYLLHAGRLIETESQQATQSKSKEGDVFSVPGASSPARTPLAEPIFLFVSDKIKPQQLGLFRFEVKDGRRQLVIGKKRKRDDDEKIYHLSLRQLDGDLYRLEAADTLDPGEYSLSPEGDNTAFCFEVY